MKYFFFILVCLFHNSADGTSCVADGQRNNDVSAKILEDLKFKLNSQGEQKDILLEFPEYIEGFRLNSVGLYAEDENRKNLVFGFPLEIRFGSEIVFVTFMLSDYLSNNNFVQAIYGKPCDLIIEYGLDYENERLILKEKAR